MEFNGTRLRTARVFRNMTISELEKKVGVSKQAISQYENNKMTPKPDVFFRLVINLGFPKVFFTEKKDAMIVENTFFRALSNARKLDLDTQETKTYFIVEIYNFLNEYLNFPKLDLPRKSEFEEIHIEADAKYLRDYWGLGNEPIQNMVDLLEKKGIIVSAIKTKTKKIDAFTQIINNNDFKQYCIILGNDKQSYVRRNFDAAHELGHIILHDNLSHVEEFSNDEFKKIEKEANQFAASFLLPEESFYRDLYNPTKLNTYIELKKKWKVSIAAMIMRSKQLGRINPGQYQNLMKNLSYRKWRISEPFDKDWELQKPQLFKNAVKMLIENKILSNYQIISQLSNRKCSLNAYDIEELLDLDSGILSAKKDNSNTEILELKQPSIIYPMDNE